MQDLRIECEDQLIRFINGTLVKKVHSASFYHELLLQCSKPGILYGFPKVHEKNCSAWPIMSAIGTYNYGLAKFLVPLLQSLTSNQYTFRSYF